LTLTEHWQRSDSRDYIACRERLKPPDYESVRDELLLRRHEGTCKWILGDPRYRTWARTSDDGQAIVWICGDQGCGKSVLSAFLTEEIVRGKVGHLSTVYFFCDDNDERLRTAHAILVNILAQVLVHIPGDIEHFLAEPAYATNKEKTAWCFGMLWHVFERIMNDANIGQVHILIDALGKSILPHKILEAHYCR